MPSRGNPNVPNKLRRIANRRKAQKRNSANRVSKSRTKVIHPTSGPLAPVSAKKARKLERLRNHAKRRELEKALERSEVDMTDAPRFPRKVQRALEPGEVQMTDACTPDLQPLGPTELRDVQMTDASGNSKAKPAN